MSHTQLFRSKKHSHQYFVDTNTGDAVCICGKLRGSPKAPANKYNATSTFYDGYWYDSKFEANQAMELDWRKKAGDIRDWERQFKIEIRNPKTGELLRNHKVDFRITHNDGSYELIETKGVETEGWKAIRIELEVLWLPDHLDYKYTVVK